MLIVFGLMIVILNEVKIPKLGEINRLTDPNFLMLKQLFLLKVKPLSTMDSSEIIW